MARTPDDPTKAQAWLWGTPPDLEMELYIPRGAKGEPGGFTTGTLLGNANLNDIKTAGIYRQVSAGYATPLNNYPEACAGLVFVYEVTPTTHLEQEFRPMWFSPTSRHSQLAYRRTLFNNIWSTWKVYAAQRVDQTAGRVIYQYDHVNQRDQLVYGDTGWRNVTSLGNATYFDTANANRQMYLRRENYQVTFAGQLQVPTGVAAFSYATCLAIPSGFRPLGGFASLGAMDQTALQIRGSTALLRFLTIGNDVAVQTINGSPLGNMTAGDVINFIGRWSVTEVWPTTLPGTAVGVIPNL